jgi:hypothetical protein
MEYLVEDFNDADTYFSKEGKSNWEELSQIFKSLQLQLQVSDQAGKQDTLIFDPKGTNAKLTSMASEKGWQKIPVPLDLQPFGKDWDSGKGSVLAEWQFSNYPFLWNNIIRSEAIFQSQDQLPQLTSPAKALVIVTKSGSIPSSNSTLYFEQAFAQISTVTKLGVFRVPIRLVGLAVPESASYVQCALNSYLARYGRETETSVDTQIEINWGRPGQYGNRSMILRAD